MRRPRFGTRHALSAVAAIVVFLAINLAWIGLVVYVILRVAKAVFGA